MRNWTGFTAAALVAVALNACGGGGDDGGNEAGKDTGFQLSASLDGTPVTGFALKDGGSTTLNIASGQELRLSASNGVTWTASMEKTTIQPKSQNSAVWDAVLISPEGGTVTLVAKSAADASKLATIRIEVPPHRYARVAAKVGETTLWREQGTTVDGSPIDRTYRDTTTAVDSQGGFTMNRYRTTGELTDTILNDADRNRTARISADSPSQTCTFTPKREHFQYPMFVGKTWTSGWQYQCGAYHETAALEASVEAFERVAVGSDTFDTLRIQYGVAFTNSNDGNLTNGVTGNAAYRMDYRCWWATELGRAVKCEFNYSYVGIEPAGNSRHYTQTALSLQ